MPAARVEFHGYARQSGVRVVEGPGVGGVREVSHERADRGPRELAAQSGRQVAPLIVVEFRPGGRPVVVLQCAAPRHRAQELDALILAQHAHVVADHAQGFAQLVGEFTGTGFAFAEPLEDPCPQRMGESFGDPDLCGFTQWARLRFNGRR